MEISLTKLNFILLLNLISASHTFFRHTNWFGMKERENNEVQNSMN